MLAAAALNHLHGSFASLHGRTLIDEPIPALTQMQACANRFKRSHRAPFVIQFVAPLT